MPVRLTIHRSDQPAATWLAEHPGEYLLGRDPRCDVVLDDARVSRRHARLTIAEAAASITDLQSKNGVALDGRPVEEAWLPEICWLSLGGLLAQFEKGDHVRAQHTDPLTRATLREHRALADPSLDVPALVERLLDSFLHVSGTERGFVLLGGQRRFEIVARRGLTATEAASNEFTGSVSTVQQVLDSGGTIARSDTGSGALPGGPPSIVREGIRALACAPLVAAGRTLGAVYADSRKPGKVFRDLDVEILGALASHAALAMWAAGLKEELEGLAAGLPTRVDEGASALPPLPGFPTWPAPAARASTGERP